MFSHFTLGSNDLNRSRKFYTALMEVLEQTLIEDASDQGYLQYGSINGNYPHTFISTPFDGLPATWSNGFHIAFNANHTQTVDQFFAVAMQHGGDDAGGPGLRVHYAKDYYAAYVRDPDGNKLQAVCYTGNRSTGRTGDVISHITLGYHDFKRERQFYLTLLGTLGYVEIQESPDFDDAAFAMEGYELPVIYIQSAFDNRPATWGNGTHVAFIAPDRQSVIDFHNAALNNGGACDGPPGLRPHYGEHYYAAYVRDPVGNKLQAVCRQQVEMSFARK